MITLTSGWMMTVAATPAFAAPKRPWNNQRRPHGTRHFTVLRHSSNRSRLTH